MSKSKTKGVTIRSGNETRTYSNTKEAYKSEVQIAKDAGVSSKQAHAGVSSLFFGGSGKTSGPK